MTDRQLLITLCNMVGALSEKLTGEKLLLCVQDTEGNYVHVYPDPTVVSYLARAAELRDGQAPELRPMRCGHQPMPDATQRLPQQSPELSAIP
ncbi:hypothetical protein LCGC14_0313380 [marine sediment metagenome]|uniref:Uncharacterized protein n=1 Tax=marine sediment metagenome TaxID=412755 RepID=A0A0F9W8R4_9ZZZZ